MSGYEKVAERLSAAFPNVPELRSLIDRLTKRNCILAGGSVVYGLNLVDKRPNDLDFFILKNDASDATETNSHAHEIINYVAECMREYQPQIRLYPDCRFSCSDPIELDEVSVISMIFETVPDLILQFIASTFVEGEDVIAGFDFDYVQCGLHRDELLTTSACEDAHQSRSSRCCFTAAVSDKRIIKTILKGFFAPFLTDSHFMLTSFEDRCDYRIVTCESFQVDFKITPFATSRYMITNQENFIYSPIRLDKLKVIDVDGAEWKWILTDGVHEVKKNFIAVEMQIDEFETYNDIGTYRYRIYVKSPTFDMLKFSSMRITGLGNLAKLKEVNESMIAVIGISRGLLSITTKPLPRLCVEKLYMRGETSIVPLQFDMQRFVHNYSNRFYSKDILLNMKGLTIGFEPEPLKCIA